MTSLSVLSRSGGIFDYEEKFGRLEEVNLELENPDVWNTPDIAQALGKERSQLEMVVIGLDELKIGIADASELLELAAEEQDEESVELIVQDIDGFEERVSKLEFQRMFSGELDHCNAFVDIQSGSGGTEAQDWADMMLRM